jgi:hypothetical protein
MSSEQRSSHGFRHYYGQSFRNLFGNTSHPRNPLQRIVDFPPRAIAIFPPCQHMTTKHLFSPKRSNKVFK